MSSSLSPCLSLAGALLAQCSSPTQRLSSSPWILGTVQSSVPAARAQGAHWIPRTAQSPAAIPVLLLFPAQPELGLGAVPRIPLIQHLPLSQWS